MKARTDLTHFQGYPQQLTLGPEPFSFHHTSSVLPCLKKVMDVIVLWWEKQWCTWKVLLFFPIITITDFFYYYLEKQGFSLVLQGLRVKGTDKKIPSPFLSSNFFQGTTLSALQERREWSSLLIELFHYSDMAGWLCFWCSKNTDNDYVDLSQPKAGLPTNAPFAFLPGHTLQHFPSIFWGYLQGYRLGQWIFLHSCLVTLQVHSTHSTMPNARRFGCQDSPWE